MRAPTELSLAWERRLAEPGEQNEARLEIGVIFTSTRETLAALKRASRLAGRLNAGITLVVPQTVPYPLPVESPPVLIEFNEKRFRALAAESGIAATARIYLCRDRWEALQSILKPQSLVVVGGRKRWWPTAEWRLAKRLGRAGHEVIFVEAE
jgi:hypothetical protein